MVEVKGHAFQQRGDANKGVQYETKWEGHREGVCVLTENMCSFFYCLVLALVSLGLYKNKTTLFPTREKGAHI